MKARFFYHLALCASIWACWSCARENWSGSAATPSTTTAASTTSEKNLKLLKACAVGDMAEVESLVNAGADVNYQANEGSKFTPLLWAVHERNYGIALFLLKKGANPNVTDATGMLPIDFISPGDTATSAEAKKIVNLIKGAAPK